jgi:hypothetical protein
VEPLTLEAMLPQVLLKMFCTMPPNANTTTTINAATATASSPYSTALAPLSS